MIYRVDEGKTDAGAIGFQNSRLAYTFSHWKSKSKFRFYSLDTQLKYKPLGPTILVEWEE